jgi:hypothetical protein
MRNSFIETALQQISEYRGYKGEVAKHIMSFNTGDFETDFEEAFIASATDETSYHPLAIIGFHQTLMDKVCWNARKLWNAQNEESPVYGVETAERTAEIVGVETNTDVKEVVDLDYQNLFQSHASLAQEMSAEVDIANLYYFSPTSLDEQTGEWQPQCTCESFDEAFTEMNNITEQLDAQQKDTLRAKFAEKRKAREKAVA